MRTFSFNMNHTDGLPPSSTIAKEMKILMALYREVIELVEAEQELIVEVRGGGVLRDNAVLMHFFYAYCSQYEATFPWSTGVGLLFLSFLYMYPAICFCNVYFF